MKRKIGRTYVKEVGKKEKRRKGGREGKIRGEGKRKKKKGIGGGEGWRGEKNEKGGGEESL